MEIQFCKRLERLLDEALQELNRSCCLSVKPRGITTGENPKVPFHYIFTITCLENHEPVNAPFTAQPKESDDELRQRLMQSIEKHSPKRKVVS